MKKETVQEKRANAFQKTLVLLARASAPSPSVSVRSWASVANSSEALTIHKTLGWNDLMEPVSGFVCMMCV